MNAHFPLLAAQFPQFDQATLPTIPAGFEDTSYRNDACPSFQHDTLGLHLFIDYAAPEDREMAGEGVRFRVDQLLKVEYDDNGKPATCWEWPSDASDTLVAESDDWMVVFGAIREAAGKAVYAGKATLEQVKGLVTEVELPAEAYAKITDLDSAKKWVMDMTNAHLSWHYDDSTHTIVNHHGYLFRTEDHAKMEAQVEALYQVDMGAYGDPFGLAIATAKEAGTQDYWTVNDLVTYGNVEALVVAVDPANRKRAVLEYQAEYIVAETNMELSADDGWTDLNEDHPPFTSKEAALAFLAKNPAT